MPVDRDYVLLWKFVYILSYIQQSTEFKDSPEELGMMLNSYTTTWIPANSYGLMFLISHSQEVPLHLVCVPLTLQRLAGLYYS